MKEHAKERVKEHAKERVIVCTRGEEDTALLGAALGRLGAPLVIQLVGPLGAGKTAFVRGLVQGLPGGADMRVQSPTFALARTYEVTPRVHHLDLYRINGVDACVELGLDDMVQDRDAIACVEWADQAAGIFVGTNTLRLTFPDNAEETREIMLEAGAAHGRVITLLRETSLLLQ